MSATDDLYERLTVDRNASADDIKKAYHRMSLKHHPDRNNNSDESKDRFQSIGEAYETLSDPAKKRQYDMTHSLGFDGGSLPPFANAEELFANLFGMGGMGFPGGIPGGFPGGIPGGPNVKFTVFQNGIPMNVSMGQQQQQQNKPTAITKKIQIDIDTVLIGGKIPVEFDRWVLEGGVKRTETTKVYVDIIQGIDSNETILVKDVGNIMHDNCIGDLKLIVEVRNDSEYVRNGLDLLLDKTISLKEALCGFSFELKYLNGKTYTITNQSGNIITPGYNKMIPKMGLQRGESRGNLIIRFHIDFPQSLNEDTMQKLGELL